MVVTCVSGSWPAETYRKTVNQTLRRVWPLRVSK
jgi:hypothetical protein